MNDGIAIAEALDNPELFGPHFRGESWNAWRAFVRALFAAPMTEEQLELYHLHTGRTEPPQKAFTEAALIVGRRGGKSRVLAFVAVALAVLRSYEEHLAAGEVATIGVLASTQRQGRSIFRYVHGLLTEIPSLRPMIANATDDTILLTNRVQIEIAAASFRSTRGYSYGAVLCDEIAFWRSEESLNPDVEILRALRPGLASIPGAIMMLASSPYGKKGALYNSYRRNYAKDDARVLVWKASTEAMNPRIDPTIISEAYQEDPEAARAEYGAEFRDDLADFITREAIDAVSMIGRKELPPLPGVEYRAFVDPSGGASDSMTLAIAHQSGDTGVLDALLEIRPPFDPDVAVAECATLLKRYRISRVVGDHYAGAWPVARFAAHAITFEQSARPKSAIYGDFLPLANAGRVELLDNTRLAAQFVGLERRVGRSGRDSIAEPPGAHDDLCNAVAGVLVGLDLDRRPTLIRPDDLRSGGQPVPLPARADAIFAVLQVSSDGMAAAVYFSLQFMPTQERRPELTILDFDSAPFTGTTIADVQAAAGLWMGRVKYSKKVAFLYLPPTLYAQQRAKGGGDFAPVPPQYLADPEALALAAAGNVSTGLVKIAQPAGEKAERHPLGAALNFRAGEMAANNDPLRLALLLGVALALDNQNAYPV